MPSMRTWTCGRSRARCERTSAARIGSEPRPGERLTIVPIAPDLHGFVRAIVEAVIAQLVMARAIENKDFTLDDFLYAQSDTKLVESPVAD